MARLPKDMVLWGWHPSLPEPIKLTSEGIRAEQRFREAHGWMTAIYRIGAAPLGFRLQVIEAKARAAGYREVSISEAGKRCCGGREELLAHRAAWEDAEGWLWCRGHLDERLRGAPEGETGERDHAERLRELTETGRSVRYTGRPIMTMIAEALDADTA